MANDSGKYLTVTGVKIADNWADLIDGSLDAPLNVNEFGGPAPLGTVCGGGIAWTGAAGPTFSNTCNDWTTTSAQFAIAVGRTNATDSAWMLWCEGGGCALLARLYCFGQ